MWLRLEKGDFVNLSSLAGVTFLGTGDTLVAVLTRADGSVHGRLTGSDAKRVREALACLAANECPTTT